MTDEKTRALLEAAKKHQELVVCGNAQHTNFEIGCPDCAVVCDYCTCPWPCDARKLADALSALTVPDGDARERLKAEALKNWQAGVEIRRYSEFFTSFEDGFDRGYAAALSRDIAGEIEAEACDVPVLGEYKRGYQDGLARAAEIARNGR